jgi:hypothetical protein
MKLISDRRLRNILKRVYPNLQIVPVCAFNIRSVYYADNTYTSKIGTSFYIDINNQPTKKEILKAYGKYQFQTDSIVLFEKI